MMREELERLAEMDEETARRMIPRLAELLDREAPDEQQQFEAAQDEIVSVYKEFVARRKNAEGIRLILQAADGDL